MNELIRLEKDNAGLRDRVAELEAALGMVVLGINRGEVPLKHQKIINGVIRRGKPDSREMIEKLKEYYE
jgi:hypothetical protein